MGNLNINGKQYPLQAEGKIQLKKIDSVKEVENDYNDDIVVDKQGQLVSISADELDVQGSLLKPYIGLPGKGEVISFVDDDNSQSVKGKVVFSEDENDAITALQRSETKEYLNQKGTEFKEAVDSSLKNTQQTIQELTPKEKPNPDQLDKDIKNLEKKIQKINKQQSAPPRLFEPSPEEKVRNAGNQVVDGSIDLVRDAGKALTGKTLTVGKTETYREGDITAGFSLGQNPSFSSSYTFKVTDMDEKVYTFGSQVIDTPHTRTLFNADAIEARVGVENTIGYKKSLGVEFNLPNKNDFSIAGTASVYGGARMEEGALIGAGFGIEGRYQLDNKYTLYGGVTQRMSYSSGGGFDISPTVEVGMSLPLNF